MKIWGIPVVEAAGTPLHPMCRCIIGGAAHQHAVQCRHTERFTIYRLQPKRVILRCCTCRALNIFAPGALARVEIVEGGS